MFLLSAEVQVYLHRDPIDFRAGINSLAVRVQEKMGLDPFACGVFLILQPPSGSAEAAVF